MHLHKSLFEKWVPIFALAYALPLTVAIAAPIGQAAFTTPGTYTWTAPAGVTSVCVVAVGGGGGGGGGYNANGIDEGRGAGGGGGGLGYKNNYAVTPGNSYTVVVGAGGREGSDAFGGQPGVAGGDSYFSSLTVVKAGGGAGGLANSFSTTLGGSYVGDGGGNGGAGGAAFDDRDSVEYPYAGGGGGAGGYNGNGGAGGSSSGPFNGANGSGGGGGGGSCFYGNGGGVGLLGQGSGGSGASGYYANANEGGGGSGGANGYQAGGAYGGGGGGGGGQPSPGAKGAVRIIWGDGRAFPSTNTQDMFPPTITGNSTVKTPRGAAFSYQITTSVAATGYAVLGTPSGFPPELTLNTSTGLITGTPNATATYNVNLVASNIVGLGPSRTLTIEVFDPNATPLGETAYTTPGIYSWMAPPGVTSVCVVCVGGGGLDGGGGLGWKNNIPVTPGNSYIVRVGGASDIGGSYFINTSTVWGGGGQEANGGGGHTGDGGGNGGSNYTNGGAGAGGGAGGYAGNGGSWGQAGAGGGGGSGTWNDSYNAGGGGGGVGIFGLGPNGAAGYQGTVDGLGGGGGSGGAAGVSLSSVNGGNGGGFGGGGGFSNDGNYGVGGGGAVRIIWGSGRAFPSTYTAPNVAAPTITVSPVNSTVAVGQSATFSFTATGTPSPTYQWMKNGVAIAGSTGSSYSVSNAQWIDSGIYTVMVSNMFGSAVAGASLTIVDTLAPTAPAGLNYAQLSAKSITLVWNASTDNVAVVGYNVYRGGTLIGTTSDLVYTDSGLSASTTYSYTVKAFDGAGNLSAPATLIPDVTTTSDFTTDADHDGIPDAAENALGTNNAVAASADTANQTQQKIHRPVP